MNESISGYRSRLLHWFRPLHTFLKLSTITRNGLPGRGKESVMAVIREKYRCVPTLADPYMGVGDRASCLPNRCASFAFLIPRCSSTTDGRVLGGKLINGNQSSVNSGQDLLEEGVCLIYIIVQHLQTSRETLLSTHY